MPSLLPIEFQARSGKGSLRSVKELAEGFADSGWRSKSSLLDGILAIGLSIQYLCNAQFDDEDIPGYALNRHPFAEHEELLNLCERITAKVIR